MPVPLNGLQIPSRTAEEQPLPRQKCLNNFAVFPSIPKETKPSSLTSENPAVKESKTPEDVFDVDPFDSIFSNSAKTSSAKTGGSVANGNNSGMNGHSLNPANKHA